MAQQETQQLLARLAQVTHRLRAQPHQIAHRLVRLVRYPHRGQLSSPQRLRQQYVRATFWYTNTVENFFSIFKRGIYGCYFHVSEAHLHRYLAEFDFRYSNRIALGVDDVERTQRAVLGAVGKRLTYRTVNRQAPEASPA